MKVNYIGIACMAVLLLTACDESKSVSYTHLTLPTNSLV